MILAFWTKEGIFHMDLPFLAFKKQISFHTSDYSSASLSEQSIFQRGKSWGHLLTSSNGKTRSCPHSVPLKDKVTQTLRDYSEQWLLSSASHWKHLGMFDQTKHLLPASLSHVSWFNGWGDDVSKNLEQVPMAFLESACMCLEWQELEDVIKL